MGRVRIGTCSDLAEAALVRAAFDAHGIHVVINAEHHASVLGGLGGAFVPLHIMVDEADAEEAAALLADLRAPDGEGRAADADADADEAARGDAAGSDDADGADDDDDDDDGDSSGRTSDVGRRVDRRRRTGIVLLLGLCVTFGTAHMSTGAWLRGIFLAGLEAYGLKMVVADVRFAWAIPVGAIVADLVGALLRVHRGPAPLPTARVRR